MPLTVNPKVMDLSHYDDVTDAFAGAVQFGIRGIINKVTEGTGIQDHSFNWRRQPAKTAGLNYGAYHFLHTGKIPEQADWFLQQIGDPTGLCLACDFEDFGGASIDEAKQFCELVKEKVGRYPILYGGNRIKEQIGSKVDPFWAQIKLWLCQYSKRPSWPKTWEQPWLWQYTGDGSGPLPHWVPGITLEGSKGLDINSFAGTDTELDAQWAL